MADPARPAQTRAPLKRRAGAATEIEAEMAMFNLTELNHSTQRIACLLLSVCIVALTLAAGAYGIESAAHPGYTITITQML
jgi:hypothetical protein